MAAKTVFLVAAVLLMLHVFPIRSEDEESKEEMEERWWNHGVWKPDKNAVASANNVNNININIRSVCNQLQSQGKKRELLDLVDRGQTATSVSFNNNKFHLDGVREACRCLHYRV